MAGKSDRQFPGSAADTGDDLRAPFAERNERRPQTLHLSSKARKRLGASALGAWRVDGIEADEILRQFD